MRLASRSEERARFATTRLLTDITNGGISYDLKCRVCCKAIERFTPFRTRQWSLEYAHDQCGWFPANEIPLSPVERRRPGTDFVYYEWQCTACKLDACAVRKPRERDDMRCRRCRPLPVLEPGVTVETISGLAFRVGRGKRPRLVRVPAYTRGELLKISGEVGLVRWEVGGECWQRTLLLVAV